MYPLFKVHVPINDALNEIKTVFESGYINEGIQVSKFKDLLSDYLNEQNLVLTNSCTSALTIALKVAGVNSDSEVITTPMTCIATNTPILNLGATVVWADIDPTSGSINAQDVVKKITDRTKAIVYVDWAGNPAEIEKIYEIGKTHGIKVIQDAAHAFGARWNDKSVSKFADFTCYSFQAIKHLSTGDGGLLVCSDPVDYALAKKLKWFGYDRDATKDEKGDWKGQRWDADIEDGEVGYKFNMNNISAAIGISQMKHIDWILNKHKQNASVYIEEFKDFELLTNLSLPSKAESTYWCFTVLVNLSEVKRNLLLEKLNLIGIGAGLVHLPNDIYSAFKSFNTELPGLRIFSSSQISIPCGWWLEEKDCYFIADSVKKLVNELGSK
jgi:perosamine synthetase